MTTWQDLQDSLTRILRLLQVVHPFDFPGTPTMISRVDRFSDLEYLNLSLS